MALTEDQCKKYLEDPYHCPFCQSEHILGENFHTDVKSVFQIVKCGSCGKGWEDNYTLTSVTTPEE